MDGSLWCERCSGVSPVIDLRDDKPPSALGVADNCSLCGKNIWGHTKEEARLCGLELTWKVDNSKFLKDTADAVMKAHDEGQHELAYELTKIWGHEFVEGMIELRKLAIAAGVIQNGGNQADADSERHRVTV
jgi:hypothetical protein